MQTTRSTAAEPPGAAPAAVRAAAPAPPAGRSSPLRTALVVFGVMLLVASVVGASWVLRSHASDGRGVPEPSAPPEGAAGGFGFVDVEGGVVPLYPLLPAGQGNQVVAVLVEQNQHVTKGTVLFRLDDSFAKEKLKEAEKDLEIAKAQLAKALPLPKIHDKLIEQQKAALAAAKEDLKRAQAALEQIDEQLQKGVGSEKMRRAAQASVNKAQEGIKGEQAKLDALQLQDPQQTVAEARGKVAAKTAQRDLARLALEKTQVVAPEDGTVLRVQVTKGELLGPQPRQAAIQFCPDGPRIVRAEIEQEFAGRVKVGQRALIQDDARISGEWRGRVKLISDWYTQRRWIMQEPRQFNDVRTLECIIVLDPKQPPLRIGQRVRVTLGK